MESEKVKEIRDKLQEEVELGKEYCLTHRRVGVDDLCDILTLINHQDFQISTLEVQVKKLEKELKKEQINHLYYRQDSQFKESRIAELEKENDSLKNRITCKIVFPDEKLEKIKKRCIENVYADVKDTLKQFAEKLIEKKVRLGERFNIYDIDETLKEFINE